MPPYHGTYLTTRNDCEIYINYYFPFFVSYRWTNINQPKPRKIQYHRETLLILDSANDNDCDDFLENPRYVRVGETRLKAMFNKARNESDSYLKKNHKYKGLEKQKRKRISSDYWPCICSSIYHSWCHGKLDLLSLITPSHQSTFIRIRKVWYLMICCEHDNIEDETKGTESKNENKQAHTTHIIGCKL